MASRAVESLSSHWLLLLFGNQISDSFVCKGNATESGRINLLEQIVCFSRQLNAGRSDYQVNEFRSN